MELVWYYDNRLQLGDRLPLYLEITVLVSNPWFGTSSHRRVLVWHDVPKQP